MPLNFDLQGKAILVTGGARGIGKAISLKLGEAGATVGVTHTGSPESAARAEAVCGEIEKLGGKGMPLVLDVTKEEQCTACVDAFVKANGGMQGLVNNGGIAIDQLVLRYKLDDWDKLMNTNLRGAFLMCKASFRPLSKAGSASIVNMSSVIGQMGNTGQVVYSAAKAGLIGMTKSLAREMSSRQVRVNAIAPGFIDTEMTQALPEEQRQGMLKVIPLASMGQAEDIAWGAAYLLSPASKYVTGQVLNINGGLYM